ncbi:hypothetical protein CBL_12831 [Carabus blaptoides fortunei]
MPLKPIKRGYKVWIRADESGSACQFQVYTGKVNDTAEKELGSRVVKDLTRDLVGKVSDDDDTTQLHTPERATTPDIVRTETEREPDVTTEASREPEPQPEEQ